MHCGAPCASNSPNALRAQALWKVMCTNIKKGIQAQYIWMHSASISTGCDRWDRRKAICGARGIWGLRKGGKRLEGMGVAHFVRVDRLNISTHRVNMFWPTNAVKFHVVNIIDLYISCCRALVESAWRLDSFPEVRNRKRLRTVYRALQVVPSCHSGWE